MPTAHAPFGPSKAKVFLNCTAAYAAGGLESSGGSFADEGKTAHDLAEYALISYRDGAHTIVDTPDGPMPVALAMKAERFNGDMFDAVSVYRDYVKSIVEELALAGVPYALFVEVRVDTSRWSTEGQFGTADCIIVSPTRLWCVDFKYGKGVAVEAEENDQLSYYGLGALDYVEFGFPDVQDVTLAICQPRVNRQVSEWVTTTEQLLGWGEEARLRVQENLHPASRQFVVGDHCDKGFCSLRRTCRARAQHYQAVAEAKAKAELSINEIAALLPSLSGLVKWANGLEEHAEKLALSGTKVPGYKLVAGRSNRYITDAVSAKRRLIGQGYDEEQIQKPSDLVSLGDLEKVVGGKKAFEELLGDLIAKRDPKPTLVPESDKRPEWTSSCADDDFSE